MEGRIGGSYVHEIEIEGEKSGEAREILLFEEEITAVFAKVIIHNEEKSGIGGILKLLQKHVISVLAQKGAFPTQKKGNAAHGFCLLPG